MRHPVLTAFGLLVAAPILCLADITNIRVTGTTATQVILAYTAPDDGACTIQVSESPSYSPLVHDVDESLFAGSASDSRLGSITSGRSRLVVVGKHGMTAAGGANPFLASDGNRYSRALQADTPHYYRITCGLDIATGTFTTSNIPLGSTYPEPPAASATSPGVYNWPSVAAPSNRAESFVDPATGTLIRKVTKSSESNNPGNKNNWPTGGMFQLCSHLLTTANGHTYDMCAAWADTYATLFSVETDTGNVYGLSRVYLKSSECSTGAGPTTSPAFSSTDPLRVYWTYNCGSGHHIYTAGWNGPLNVDNPVAATPTTRSPDLSVTDLTPNSSVQTLLSAFDPAYDATQQANIRYLSVVGAQIGKLLLQAVNQQDSLAWVVVFDPGNNRPLGSGGTGGIVAATPVYRLPAARWCSLHTLTPAGDNNPWISAVSNNLRGGAWSGTYSVVAGADDGLGSTIHIRATNGSYEPQSDNAPAYIQDAQPGDLFLVNSLAGPEYVELVSKDTGAHTWTVLRGDQLQDSVFVAGSGMTARTFPKTAVAAGMKIYAACRAKSIVGNGAAYWYWNFVNDPHGNSIAYPAANGDSSNQVVENRFQVDHEITRDTLTISDLQGGSFDSRWQRWDYSPAPGYGLSTYSNVAYSANPVFAGVRPWFSAANNGDYATHPSWDHPSASGSEQNWLVDAMSFLNNAGGYTGSAALVGGQTNTYLYTPQHALHRKQLTTLASCGTHPLVDISGPASAISDATPYTYCVANAGGECVQGSGAGSVYVSCPGVTMTHCDSSSRLGSVDICIGDSNSYANAAIQVDTKSTDMNSAGIRAISSLFAQNHQENQYNNVRPTSDGKWMMFFTPSLTGGYAGGTGEVYMAKLPPFPPTDSIRRDTFLPAWVSVRGSPAGGRAPSDRLAKAKVAVEFGYAENGEPGDFFCTSRREACVVQSDVIDESHPFYFSETEAGSITGIPCASGCTVAIPALPGRVLYYRVGFRDNLGNVIARQQMAAQAVP